MVADLNNLPIVDTRYNMCIAYCAKSMCNDDGCDPHALLEKTVDTALNHFLRFSIKGGRSFIQKKK